MSIFKRLRPGSGAAGQPVSRTEGADHIKKARSVPTEGMSAPGAADEPFSHDGVSWPVALSTAVQGDRVIAEPESDDEPLLRDGTESRPFAPHDPDDPAVLSKLFGLSV